MIQNYFYHYKIVVILLTPNVKTLSMIGWLFLVQNVIQKDLMGLHGVIGNDMRIIKTK